MKVVVTINENYVYPLQVMLYSLFSTQEEPVTVILMHAELSAAIVETLKAFCSSYCAELSEVRIDKEVFDKAPVKRYFSKEMYYRLICPWLLLQEERVLYLDPDTIIIASLRKLWETELDGALLAAAKDRVLDAVDSGIKGELKKDSIYVNSGVLLMDLRKIRQEIRQDDLYALMADRGASLEFPDQDILNLLYEGKIHYMDNSYNVASDILHLKEYLGAFIPGRIRRSAKIIHYAGYAKPWRSGYRKALYPFFARAEWYAHPSRRFWIFGRLLMEPYRFIWGLYKFVTEYDYKKGFDKKFHLVLRKALAFVKK